MSLSEQREHLVQGVLSRRYVQKHSPTQHFYQLSRGATSTTLCDHSLSINSWTNGRDAAVGARQQETPTSTKDAYYE